MNTSNVNFFTKIYCKKKYGHRVRGQITKSPPPKNMNKYLYNGKSEIEMNVINSSAKA